VTKIAVNNEEALYSFLRDSVGLTRIAKGFLETARLLERSKARTVIIAANVVPPDRLDVIRALSERKGVRILIVSDKRRLGKAVGLDVGASCVALPAEVELT
jgi:ribosomal protein L7Ae-like RNA K-turn-binding protein